MIIKIIELFILDHINGLQIEKAILEFYQLNSTKKLIIYIFIVNVLKYITHYLKEFNMTTFGTSNL